MKFRPSHGVPLLLLAAVVSEHASAAVVARPDTRTTPVGVPITIDVLANDTIDYGVSFFEVEGEGAITAQNGVVTVDQETNEVTYTPDEGFEGVDTFEYFVQEGSPDYGSGMALVTVNVGSSGSSLNENEQNTADMLDDVCAADNRENRSADLEAACQDFNNLDSDDQAELASQITPEEILMVRRMMSQLNRGQTQRIYSGQQLIRQGFNPSQLVLNGTSIPLAANSGGAASGEQAPPIAVFGTIHIDQVEHDASNLESAYEADSYGATVGVDYRLRSDLHVGGAFDWVTHEVEYEQKSGQLDSDLYSFTGYLSWFRDALGIDVQLGYAVGEIETQRNITIPTTQAVYGDTDSQQWNISAQAQWTFSRDAWTLTPYLRFDYINTEIDDYEETGSSAWLMAVGDQEMSQVSTALGLTGTYAKSYSWGVWVPGFDVSMVSENSADYSPVAFSLLGDSSDNGNFSLQPESEDSLFYETELNSVFILAGGFSTFLSAKMLSGYDNVEAYQFNLGLNYEL